MDRRIIFTDTPTQRRRGRDHTARLFHGFEVAPHPTSADFTLHRPVPTRQRCQVASRFKAVGFGVWKSPGTDLLLQGQLRTKWAAGCQAPLSASAPCPLLLPGLVSPPAASPSPVPAASGQIQAGGQARRPEREALRTWGCLHHASHTRNGSLLGSLGLREKTRPYRGGHLKGVMQTSGPGSSGQDSAARGPGLSESGMPFGARGQDPVYSVHPQAPGHWWPLISGLHQVRRTQHRKEAVGPCPNFLNILRRFLQSVCFNATNHS